MSAIEVVLSEDSDSENDQNIEVIIDDRNEENNCDNEEGTDEYDSYVFENRKTQDDPFGYLMWLSVDIFELKSVQQLIIFSLFVHFFTISSAIYNLIKDQDPKLVLKYNGTLLFDVCAIFMCWYAFPLSKQIQKLRHFLEDGALQPELYPERTKWFLRNIAPFIHMLFATATVIVPLSSIAILILMQNTQDSIYYTEYLRTKWSNPKWFIYFQILYGTTCQFIILLCLGTVGIFNYYLLQVYLHTLTVRGYFEIITDGIEDEQQDEQELITNEELLLERPDNIQYQKEITRRLKFCFKLYNHLQTFQYEGNRTAFVPLVVVTTTSAAFIFAIMYQLFFVLSPDHYLSCFLQICIAVGICIPPPIQVQLVIDESDLLNSTIWNTQWYEWNIRNQNVHNDLINKIVQIGSRKSHRFGSYDEYQITAFYLHIDHCHDNIERFPR